MKTAIQTNSKRKYVTVVMYPNCRVCRVTPLVTEADRIDGVCAACSNKPKSNLRTGRGLAPNCKGRDAVLAAYNASPNASLRKLAEICKLTAPTVQYHLQVLNELGKITYQSVTRPNRETSAARAARNAKRSALKGNSKLTIDQRIDAIVKRNENNTYADTPQHDVVRHINRPLNMRRGGRLG